MKLSDIARYAEGWGGETTPMGAPDGGTKARREGNGGMKAIAAAIALASLSLAGCAQFQKLETDIGVPPATAARVAAIGGDLVSFECTDAGTVSVAAADINASARVQGYFTTNAKLASLLCPILTGVPDPTVVVNAPAPLPAAATPSVVVAVTAGAAQ